MKTKILSKMRRNIHQFNSRSINPIVVLALFILITWTSRFYYFTQFGIYEDDHYRVPVAMAWNWSEFWQFLSLLPSNLIQMNGQGRMLHPSLIQTFSFLGEQLGGLSAIYLFGFCIVATNTILFYYLLKRLYNQPIFVIAGTLTFALFPADTTQAFLTHALGVQPALMLLLIAFHLYISKRRSFTFLSYLCIFTSLFIYEKFFLVFLAAPLLKQSPKSLKRELIQHSMLLSGAFIAVAIARRLQ
ncbi:MAG TPA: hypothetical protein DEV81_09075, partial [Cyanobacteria bacterium UBA11049]|nr:hypothetical protein [Cyanobacteria bacterium UBA11049]